MVIIFNNDSLVWVIKKKSAWPSQLEARRIAWLRQANDEAEPARSKKSRLAEPSKSAWLSQAKNCLFY